MRRSEFEGVFNLSLLSLIFALSYNIVRSIMEHGNRVTFQVSLWKEVLFALYFNLQPLFCKSFNVDLEIAMYFWLFVSLYSLVYFFLMKLLCLRLISVRALFWTYIVFQLLLLIGGSRYALL